MAKERWKGVNTMKHRFAIAISILIFALMGCSVGTPGGTIKVVPYREFQVGTFKVRVAQDVKEDTKLGEIVKNRMIDWSVITENKTVMLDGKPIVMIAPSRKEITALSVGTYYLSQTQYKAQNSQGVAHVLLITPKDATNTKTIFAILMDDSTGSILAAALGFIQN
jgi:hypothetical protein